MATIDHMPEPGSISHKPSAIVRDVYDNNLRFLTFSSKAKATLKVNQDNYDATINFRIENNKSIWMSITALLGIEVARVLITPERIAVVNRMNSTYLDKPYTFIAQLTGAPLSFHSIQSLLLGDAINEINTGNQPVIQNNLGILLSGLHEELNFTIQTNKQLKVLSTTIASEAEEQSIETNYADFIPLNKQQFPQLVQLTARSEQLSMRTQLVYGKITLNAPITSPFHIPANYKALH